MQNEQEIKDSHIESLANKSNQTAEQIIAEYIKQQKGGQ